LNSIKEEMTILKANPLLHQIRYDKTRFALIEKFPYLIHFEIDKNTIAIKLRLQEIQKFGRIEKIIKTIFLYLSTSDSNA